MHVTRAFSRARLQQLHLIRKGASVKIKLCSAALRKAGPMQLHLVRNGASVKINAVQRGT